MRNLISYSALAVALTAGASVSVAHAQAVDTVIVPAPAPVQTVETVRTVQSTTTPRHFARHDRVTTTRTTVTERAVPAPIAQPTYTEVVQSPYPRLYDVAMPAHGAVGPAIAPGAASLPTYRYVYEPNRILVIDPYTNIAVQAIPR
jgi:hypothetical protein